MPLFSYRGRDKLGSLRVGERESTTADTLNLVLIKEGVIPVSITLAKTKRSLLDSLLRSLPSRQIPLEELTIFTRQMQLLYEAGVSTVTALKQLASGTRSPVLARALNGLAEYIEKGQSLATAMQNFPKIFSPLMINIVQIGETTGHLGEAFGHLNTYLSFESTNNKQIKSAFRYPMFVFIAMISAVFTINIFVVPSFAKFYTNLNVSLPWQTKILIGTSNFFLHYSYYVLAGMLMAAVWAYRYFQTPRGRYLWDKYALRIPVMGGLLKRMVLIRFCQSLSIILTSGISVTQGLILIKNTITNTYVTKQISQMQESIERGISFNQAILTVDLFSQLEIQILSVGEKSGELSPALNFISEFHTQEIQFDLKRMTDLIGPILLATVSILVLILALGVYLPIWNMVDTVHS